MKFIQNDNSFSGNDFSKPIFSGSPTFFRTSPYQQIFLIIKIRNIENLKAPNELLKEF